MRRARVVPVAVTVIALSLASPRAHADDPAPAPARPQVGARPAKRAVPDYDGRPDAASALDVIAWVPRIVLFPVRIAVDYLVRWPIGAVVRTAEHSRGGRKLFSSLFLQPKTPTPSLYPVALYDFGFKPSLGVRLKWTDGFLTPGSKLSVKLGFGGTDLWRFDTAIRFAIRRLVFLGLEAGVRRRPDHMYFGLGPRAPDSARARYGSRKANATVQLGARLASWGELSVFSAGTTTAFMDSTFNGGPTIEAQVAAGVFPEPNDYAEGFATVRGGVEFSLDSRGEDLDRSGARLDGVVERVWAEDGVRAWTRIDVVAGAALLLDPVAERHLDLRIRLQLVEAANDVDLPFSELASTGGSRDLRGFPSGRLLGESALAFLLDYKWPLGAWLDAHAHLGAGSSFGPQLSGFGVNQMSGSIGGGLSIAGFSDDRQVELWTAVGTGPFEDGFDVTSFRLVLGWSDDY